MALNKVVTGKVTFTARTPPDLSTCTKRELRAYFENSYDLNESLFTSLKDDSVFYLYPDALRLPLIFYYGHTASVYINKMMLAGLLQPHERVNMAFEEMFETGVDEMSWDDTENYRMGGLFQWPALDDVIAYRRQVRNLVLSKIMETPLSLPINMDSPWWSLVMGIEHEHIHLETSSVLIRQLPVEFVSKPEGWKYAPSMHGPGVTKNPLIRVPKTEVTLGKPKDIPSYGWDNEYGEVKCQVPDFEAAKYLTTNKEFLEFVLAGGYEERAYWSKEGWKWAQFRQAKHPAFWICDKGCRSGCGGDLRSHSHCKIPVHLANGQNSYCNGHATVDDNGHQGKDEGGGKQYRLRVMFDHVSMPWDWPVVVNYHEAHAFCMWRGPQFRLALEAEHNVMRGPQPSPSTGVTCDIIYQDDIPANTNFKYGSSTPVNMFPPSALGFHDTFGNVWEWVEDHFNGFPGHETHPYYDDFSAPTYDGRHNVILGGSWISTGDEASRFARYAFRRHFFQHAGFRVVRNVEKGPGKVQLPLRLITNINCAIEAEEESPVDLDHYDIVPVRSCNTQYEYESLQEVHSSLMKEYTGAATYTTDLVQLCMAAVELRRIATDRAMHLGCATGRVTFEMAKYFKQVLALDFASCFVKVCEDLQAGHSICVPDGSTKHTVTLPGGMGNIKNINFKQLTWLPNEVQDFDFILVTQLDRSLNAKAWLLRMNEVLRPGGLLVIVSGNWQQEKLTDVIGHQFCIIEQQGVLVDDKVTRVTMLQHKDEVLPSTCT